MRWGDTSMWVTHLSYRISARHTARAAAVRVNNNTFLDVVLHAPRLSVADVLDRRALPHTHAPALTEISPLAVCVLLCPMLVASTARRPGR